ncbi:Sodium- and chloride-dependent GABA transporter 2 [Takifugu flavidus]|uniref:Transporter n=1 Tax=Takifugu flavidus TaxID=433684 RepID=A0A5C6NUN0_9TELE|nr:Sodium- and chloride-dependent GABA transporter 2 [Takifugu flavidus]
MQSKAKREQWTRKREYILASAGHIVGLGNVWRFPYLCYKNGGGVFLLPYCFFAVLCGVPLFLLETVIGTGYFILIIQLYSRVYTVVLAWALLYIIYCFRDPLPWATCSSPWNTDRCVDLSSVNLTTLQRENLTVNVTSGNLTKSATIEFWERGLLSMSGGIEELGKVKWELLLCLLSCWMGCYFCIWKGVRSTGKVVYFTAIFPYVMLVILLIWGLSLPGAMQGVVFYLYPDVSRLADLQVWLDACSQVLFSYGVSDTVWLCLLNSCTSFVAGFTVFTVLGFMAQKQDVPIGMVVDSGPGLAFIAFPQAVTMMPLPQFWAVCFFLMLMFLGLDTTGGVYLFQLVDYYAANGTCIMFGSIIHCVAVGWAFGADKICDVLEDITGHRPWAFYKLCWRYFTPLICTVCFICSFINYQPLISSNGYEYPAWAYSLGWAMALSSIVTIPIYAIGKLCLTKGTLRQRLMVLWYPADGNNPNTEHTAKETELQHLSAPPS